MDVSVLLEYAFPCILIVASVIAFIITFVRTGSVKKSLDNFKEVICMSKDSKNYSQTFSDKIPQYILNPATNELERLEVDKNIQKYIDSYIDCALASLQEKFMPTNVAVDDNNYVDYTQRVDDLGSLGEAMEIAENYREKFNLPDNYTIAQIYDFVDNQAKVIKSRLSSKVKSDNSNDKEEK